MKQNLKEDLFMDASTTLASPQAIISWIMLGALLVWMVTFAVLAFYPFSTRREQSEDHTKPTSTFPVTPTPRMLHAIVSPPIGQHIETDRHDTDEMEAVSVR
jgi:predicted secreted protein